MAPQHRSTETPTKPDPTPVLSYVERIAEEAESAADAAEMVRVKVARHGKGERRVGRKGGTR